MKTYVMKLVLTEFYQETCNQIEVSRVLSAEWCRQIMLKDLCQILERCLKTRVSRLAQQIVSGLRLLCIATRHV